MSFSRVTRNSSCKLCLGISDKTAKNKESVPVFHCESEATLFLAEAKGVWEIRPKQTSKVGHNIWQGKAVLIASGRIDHWVNASNGGEP